MAVELQTLSNWLNNMEIKHHMDTKDSKIFSGGNNDGNKIIVKIKLTENGEMFQIYSNLVIDDDLNELKIKDHEHAGLVLQQMLKINYEEKFGTWEFDPTDGEVRFAVEIPLEDAVMTENQFQRIFKHVFNSADNFGILTKILETGELPADEEDSITDLLEAMLLSLKQKKAEIARQDEDGI